MRTKLVLLITAVLVVGLAAPMALADTSATESDIECDFPLTVEDATGTEITLDEPPERVVTTNPSAAQIMWELGASDKVVGLTQFALYLENADDKTLISEGDEIVVLEQVVELEPDLVLAPNATDAETVEQMRDVGLTVYHFPMEEDLDDVFAKTERIGELTDECQGAEETTQWMDEQLSIGEAAVEGEERPGVMYMFFDFTAGSGTFITEIIEAAGADNLAAEAGIEGYQPISEEVVIDEDPEWIILNSDDPALPDSDAINETTAAQEDQIVVVEIEHLNQPAPRNVLAIITLVEHFHPEAFEQAKAEAEADDTDDDADDADDAPPATDADDTDDTPAEPDDETDDTTAETDEDDIEEDDAEDEPDATPGFGPVLAAGGMALGILLLRHRK